MNTFPDATSAEIDRVVTSAESSFEAFSSTPPEQIARLLEAIGAEIEALGDELIDCAARETSLPPERLRGERARTTNQLRMFAGLVRDGSWKEARMDGPLPDRQPTRRPDLRRMLIPIGP